MNQHGHSHGTGHANRWTTLNAFGTFTRDLLTNPWGLGLAIDNLAGWDPEVLEVSENGLIIGSCLSTLFAICGTYVHKIVNTRHQQSQAALQARAVEHAEEEKAEERDEEDPHAEHGHGEDALVPIQVHAHGRHNEQALVHTSQHHNLGRWQSASIGIDFIAHTISISTLLVLTLQPVDFSSADIPDWLVTVVIYLSSASASRAELRMCSHNMEEPSGHDHHEQKKPQDGHPHAGLIHQDDHEAALLPAHSAIVGYGGLAASEILPLSIPKPDGWTRINIPIEFVIHLISNVSFFGRTIIDTFFDLSAKTLGLSWYGLTIGGTIGLWAAVGATHKHYTRNLAYQSHAVSHALPSETEIRDFNHRSKFSTYISTPGDKIAHFTKFASPFINTLRLTLPSDFPLWANILISLTIMTISAPISYADSHTCRTIERKFKYFITQMNEGLNDDDVDHPAPPVLVPNRSQLQY